MCSVCDRGHTEAAAGLRWLDWHCPRLWASGRRQCMCYLCPGNVAGPGARPTCQGAAPEAGPLPCLVAGKRRGISLPDPHSLYGALLSSASADCKAASTLHPPPSSLLPPPLPPSPSLCHPLTSPGASDQVPAVAWGIQGQPPAVGCRTAPHTFSSPPSPGSSFQVSLGALNGEVLVLNKDSGAGHGAVLPSHMAVTHPHRQQGPGCLPCTHSLGGPA